MDDILQDIANLKLAFMPRDALQPSAPQQPQGASMPQQPQGAPPPPQQPIAPMSQGGQNSPPPTHPQPSTLSSELMGALEQMALMLEQVKQEQNETREQLSKKTNLLEQRIAQYEAQVAQLSGKNDLLLEILNKPPEN